MSARSHGISCTSFLVYSPDLPIQVTIAFLDFAVFGQLVPCIRLNIRFLFVEPRFRYVFLSPPLTEVSFDSRYRVHRQQVPQGNCTSDVQHARRTKKQISSTDICFFSYLNRPVCRFYRHIRSAVSGNVRSVPSHRDVCAWSCVRPWYRK